METGHDFGGLGHPGEIRRWPWTAETERLGRLAIEVSHVCWQRFIASIERARHGPTEDTEVFLRRIDLHGGIDLQKMIQSAGMIAMAMGDDGEVELREVDALGLHIVCKDFGIVAGVEQNALVAILYEGGKPPIL